MGKFPQSFEGAKAIIEESARIAKWGGAERLIVKTVKEAHQIPRIEDNLNALSWSYQASQTVEALPVDYHEVTAFSEQIFEEADFLLNLLLNADPDLEKGIRQVFRLGYWDVPYCLHPDNQRLSYAHIDEMGYIHWATPGKIPFPLHMLRNHHLHYQRLSSREFLTMLSFNQYKYDRVYEKWKVRSTA
jgi:methylaspartate mutase epsilon subunit